MSPDQCARALRLADEMERGQTLGYSWGVLDAVALLRELAAEPVRVPMTEQEIWDAVEHGRVGGIGFPSKAVAVARAVEARHGITGDAK